MTGPAPTDPQHWLRRLTAEEWQRAAEHELSLCLARLQQRSVRAGVTHARRAAGMAWNAVLLHGEDPAYGRSYMEHVVALATDAAQPEAIRTAARLLGSAPTLPPTLIQIGKPDLSAHEAAAAIVAHARALVAAASGTPRALTTN